ncbi:hypothetical protein [Natronoglomus mannanivorans]|uniref:Rpa-associated protein n=1 Tax=Natronoglomus mannanivorans TaxID=2979990 RepID=A0AAP2Z0E2_9EURY|nr:hypothetical protein [Halobacteria archaeon AArc-xg1-1]
MSSNSSSSSSSSATGDVGREVAYRLFAAEYDDASLSHAESDEERAPNYVITPTGARVNRLFAVGTLTEITPVNDEMLRARIVDPTGAFVVYAGQYQPEALAFLEGAEPPLFVAVTGKARTFQPEDSERVYTSVRPESLATVDAETRDRWVVTTAEQTIERVGAYATAAGIDASGDELTDVLRENGLEEGLARGIPLAQDHYGTTPDYLAGLHELAADAVRVVAGERDEVGSFALAPNGTDGRGATFADLAGVGGLDVDVDEAVGSDVTASPDPDTASTTAADDGSVGSEAVTESEPETATTATDDSEGDALESDSSSDTDAVVESDVEVDETVSADDSAEITERETETETTDDIEGDDTEETDEATDVDSSTDDLETVDSSDFDDDMYEMDEEERAEIEAEFGTEFTTGAEVDEPGEADIDVPEPDDELEAETEAETGSAADVDVDTEESEAETETETETEGETEAEAETESGGLGDFQTESDGLEDSSGESEAETETETETESETDPEPSSETDDTGEEPAEDVDLQEYVVDTMRELDDGSGADRTAIVETVAEETGADEDDVDDAIEDALMGGQCYEPDDETLKPI